MSHAKDARDMQDFKGDELTVHPVPASAARQAALTIADRALDADDCRRLLAMCGLAQDDGREPPAPLAVLPGGSRCKKCGYRTGATGHKITCGVTE